jgi:prepilin-type N-terminal cleavage/methylation domain-containing protein
MHKRAFTLIEVLVVVAIVAILAGIVFLNLTGPKPGDRIRLKGTGVTAVVVSRPSQEKGAPNLWIVRIDNGPGVNPRFTELHVAKDEMEALAEEQP